LFGDGDDSAALAFDGLHYEAVISTVAPLKSHEYPLTPPVFDEYGIST
jgi:hypothetical protein